MYITEIPDDIERYQEISVDGRVFYKIKEESKVDSPRRRRYSDQFKDPLFIQKDINRKLKMIKQFKENHGDLSSSIDQWKDCITECISILNDQYQIPGADIFKLFNLKRHGFGAEDYGIYESTNE